MPKTRKQHVITPKTWAFISNKVKQEKLHCTSSINIPSLEHIPSNLYSISINVEYLVLNVEYLGRWQKLREDLEYNPHLSFIHFYTVFCVFSCAQNDYT